MGIRHYHERQNEPLIVQSRMCTRTLATHIVTTVSVGWHQRQGHGCRGVSIRVKLTGEVVHRTLLVWGME